MSSGNTNTLTSSHLSVGTGGLSTSSVCNCSGFAVCGVHASNSREAVLSAERHSLGPGAGQEEAGQHFSVHKITQASTPPYPACLSTDCRNP